MDDPVQTIRFIGEMASCLIVCQKLRVRFSYEPQPTPSPFLGKQGGAKRTQRSPLVREGAVRGESADVF